MQARYLALIALTLATPALAHTGHGTGGMAYGFSHPLGGLDHLLAMLAVGLWAAQSGGRALWAVPAAFIAAMLAGWGLAAAGVSLPLVEPGIVGSVIVFGALIAFAAKLPDVAGMAVVGVFALFHGHAHGSEMPIGADGLAYAAGFVLATALLHAAGMAAGWARRQHASRIALRVAGAGIAGAGMALAGGLLG